jgi:hypothetical protein
MNIEAFEDSIKTRLEDKLSNSYKVVIMEDTETEANRSVTSPEVAICYFQSDYDSSLTTGHIRQDETVLMYLMLTCRKRRGLLGIYALYTEVKKFLLGWTPTGCTHKLQFKTFQFQKNHEGWFIYSLVLETKALIVEDITEEETVEEELVKSTKISFEP